MSKNRVILVLFFFSFIFSVYAPAHAKTHHVAKFKKGDLVFDRVTLTPHKVLATNSKGRVLVAAWNADVSPGREDDFLVSSYRASDVEEVVFEDYLDRILKSNPKTQFSAGQYVNYGYARKKGWVWGVTDLDMLPTVIIRTRRGEFLVAHTPEQLATVQRIRGTGEKQSMPCLADLSESHQ